MVDSEEQPKVDLISSTQVFPIGKHEETTVLLSVVDAIVIHYGPSSVVCFFDSSLDSEPRQPTAIISNKMDLCPSYSHNGKSLCK
jgi:hypothetical protein